MTADLQAHAEDLARQAAEARTQAEAEAVERWEAEDGRGREWARRLLDAFDDDDAALHEAERQATRAFVEALLATAWAQAWVAARAARLARETLAREASGAAELVGGDIRIPDLAYRDPRLIESITGELEAAAHDAAADVDDERTTERDTFVRGDQSDDKPRTAIHPELLALLTHAPDCAGERVETVTGGIRCCDCTARHITPPPPEPLPPPDSAAYAQLWRSQPFKIAEQLDPADRDNPNRNPLHPMAPSDAPGHEGGRPTP